MHACLPQRIGPASASRLALSKLATAKRESLHDLVLLNLAFLRARVVLDVSATAGATAFVGAVAPKPDNPLKAKSIALGL